MFGCALGSVPLSRQTLRLVVALSLAATACADARSQNGEAVSEPASTEASSSSAVEPAEEADGQSSTSAPAATTSDRLETTGAFEPAECRMELPPGITGNSLSCGFVTVPLDHLNPAGRTIRLAVVFVDNGSDHPPVLFLPGGPGASGQSIGGGFVGAPFDVIAFDERGVGRSEPSLDCHETSALYEDIVGKPVAGTIGPYQEALRSCRQRLVGSGIDLEFYSSAQSARDMGAVHRALGFDEVTVLAGSYGTRLALTKARDEPDGIRGMVLDAVIPLDRQLLENQVDDYLRAFDLMVAGCEADPGCRAMGDLTANIERLAAQLDEEPLSLTGERPFDQGSADLLIDGDRFRLMVLGALYVRPDFERLPLRVAQALAGDTDALLPMAETTLFLLDPAINASEGYQLSVMCHEEQPFNDPAEIRADFESAPSHFFDPFTVEENCSIWDTTLAPPIENEPVVTAIPTLIFAGEFDPVSPPEAARQVAERLPNSTLVEVPGEGHGAVPTSSCTRSILEAFVVDPTSDLDLSCVDELEPPNWRS